jgi:hypothetical protein
MGASTSHNPVSLHGLYKDSVALTYLTCFFVSSGCGLLGLPAATSDNAVYPAITVRLREFPIHIQLHAADKNTQNITLKGQETDLEFFSSLSLMI